MRYLVEVNLTTGYKAIAGFEVFGEAGQYLHASDFAEVHVRDTVTGQIYLAIGIDLDSEYGSDCQTDRDVTAFLNGADFIQHQAAAA